MSYSSIRTRHSVGDIVYFHDSESDTVQRGVVTGIEARCTDPGYSSKWSILYDVAHKFASDPGRPSLIGEGDLHGDPAQAWPPLPAIQEAG